RPRPRVATQTRIPFRESFLKLLKRVTGWTAPASCTVTATTSDGLSAPARWTSQPDAGRKLASRECRADPPLVAMPSATANTANGARLRSLMPTLRRHGLIGPRTFLDAGAGEGLPSPQLAEGSLKASHNPIRGGCQSIGTPILFGTVEVGVVVAST